MLVVINSKENNFWGMRRERCAQTQLCLLIPVAIRELDSPAVGPPREGEESRLKHVSRGADPFASEEAWCLCSKIPCRATILGIVEVPCHRGY